MAVNNNCSHLLSSIEKKMVKLEGGGYHSLLWYRPATGEGKRSTKGTRSSGLSTIPESTKKQLLQCFCGMVDMSHRKVVKDMPEEEKNEKRKAVSTEMPEEIKTDSKDERTSEGSTADPGFVSPEEILKILAEGGFTIHASGFAD